jgi:N,N'-diacetyllegionaminate synthase
MSCFIIAEAGVNHNGSVDLAFKLVEVAAEAGADAVKFQSFHADALVSKKAATAEYQKKTTGSTFQFDMLKKLELSIEAHQKIAAHCRAFNIEFMSTGFDIASIDFLCALGVRRLKIPSGEITHHQLLSHVATKNLPIILSTGMASLEEIAAAITVISATRKKLGLQRSLSESLTLLHCTSNYPADFSDINLRAMQTMEKVFKLPIGYSDHSAGIVVAPLAVAMGACVVEKHFTLDKHLPGPDHAASLTPQELLGMVQHIRLTEKILGDPEKAPCSNELSVRDVVRRSITLAKDKQAHMPLELKDLVLLRPGTGIPPSCLNTLIGKTLKHDLVAGTTLQWEDVDV